MNPRLESLLNRWIDGELSPPEAEAVQRMLADDPEARRECYQLLMVDQLLAEHIEGRRENIVMMESIARETIHGRKGRFRRAPLAIAALVVFSLFAVFLLSRQNPVSPARSGPVIIGSTDSRMTIAQRQDTTHWGVGELLRLERGSADIQLNTAVSACLDGPAALELIDKLHGVKLVEGMASFSVGAGRNAFDVQVPGGILRELDCRFTTEVFADGITNVRVESGLLEIHGRGPLETVYLKAGEAACLEPDGWARPIRLPNHHFRSGLPQDVALFRDNFQGSEGLRLDQHQPQIGQTWKVLSEAYNPTVIRNQRLDTSSGAKRLMANLVPHDATGSRSVYIFKFDLTPPERIQDKVSRQGGIESISLVDETGRQTLSILAKAANNHRWQLMDEDSKATTALTPVCALWKHSLTLCYGLDGLVTLHDGSTAQAPIIAELRLAQPRAIAGFVVTNIDGGDLAFSNIETTLLQSPSVKQQ